MCQVGGKMHIVLEEIAFLFVDPSDIPPKPDWSKGWLDKFGGDKDLVQFTD